MAAKGRRSPHNLIEALGKRPHRFEFFQAVRVLEMLGRRQGRDPRFEKLRAVGEDADPKREAVRFTAAQSLAFPTSEIATFRETKPEPEAKKPPGPPRMSVGFMGLTGPSGVLPQQFTEMLIRSVRSKSVSLRDFLDLFNHRTISLFYRAWEKYRLPPSYERGGAGGNDAISGALYDLVGLGSGHLRKRLKVNDEALIHYSGHLSHGPKSAAGLESMLSDYFERPVEIEQFKGRWMNLALDELSTLPGPHDLESSFCQLGVTAVIGDRVWDVQGSFRIKLGPLTYAQFVRFMPSGDELKKLAELTRLYIGPGLSVDVQLTLAKDDVPDCQLVADGDGAPRLGWNTWIKQAPYRHDVDDAVYLLDKF